MTAHLLLQVAFCAFILLRSCLKPKQNSLETAPISARLDFPACLPYKEGIYQRQCQPGVEERSCVNSR